MCKINLRCKRIVDLDTIDQHDGVIGFGATNADLRNGAGRSLATYGDSWHRSQRVGDQANLSLLEFGRRQDADRRARICKRGFGAARANNHLLQGGHRRYLLCVRTCNAARAAANHQPAPHRTNSGSKIVFHRPPASKRPGVVAIRMQRRLHTIAHRDRVAEAAARCSGSPIRPVSGLVNTARVVRTTHAIGSHLPASDDAVAYYAIRHSDLPLRGQCRL